MRHDSLLDIYICTQHTKTKVLQCDPQAQPMASEVQLVIKSECYQKREKIWPGAPFTDLYSLWIIPE